VWARTSCFRHQNGPEKEKAEKGKKKNQKTKDTSTSLSLMAGPTEARRTAPLYLSNILFQIFIPSLNTHTLPTTFFYSPLINTPYNIFITSEGWSLRPFHACTTKLTLLHIHKRGELLWMLCPPFNFFLLCIVSLAQGIPHENTLIIS
jgi:hypothetical protein